MPENFTSGATDFEPHQSECPTCGKSYFKDEKWKHLCLKCYLAKKPADKLVSVPATPPIEPGMLRRLIQLCHPDKHGNSEAATLATQWLLKLRNE